MSDEIKQDQDEVKEVDEVKETDDIKEVEEVKVPQKSNGFLDDIIEICRWAKNKITSDEVTVTDMPTETASRKDHFNLTYHDEVPKKRWWWNKYVKMVATTLGIWIVVYPILMLILPTFVSWITTFVVGLVVSNWIMNRESKKGKILPRPRSYSPSPGVRFTEAILQRGQKSQLQNLFNDDILSREIGIGSSVKAETHHTHSVIDPFEDELEDELTAMSGSVFVSNDVTAMSGSSVSNVSDVNQAFAEMFDLKESRDSITNDEIKKTLDDERNELLKAQLDVATKEINDMLMELRAFHTNKKKTKGTGAH